MHNLLDLTDLNTKRYFIVGELHGNHDALMRLLFQQNYKFSDTLILCGDFFDVESPKIVDLIGFLHNTMNAYAVKGEREVQFLKDLTDPEKKAQLYKKIGKYVDNERIIKYLNDLPLVIKMGDFYAMHAGVDPMKSLEDQDPEVFFSIGEYDKDSRFYQYSNEKEESWYQRPYLVNGKHVNICFGHVYSNVIEVPAGYNLGRNPEIDLRYRCVIIQKDQWISSIINWQ